ncbi:MAG TPA: PilN domain-containing protein [Acetobacteraceae bacterium]
MISALASATAAAKSFLRWWLTELREMLPASLRRGVFPRERLILSFEADSAVFLKETPSGPTELARLDLVNAPDGQAVAQAMRRRHPRHPGLLRRNPGLCLRLPSSSALRVRMELPAAAKDNVTEVVTFEMDRYTPFRAEQVYFACALAGGSLNGQHLPVDVTVVPRPTVESALQAATRLGVQPDQVDVAAPSPAGRPSGTLRIEDTRPATPIVRKAGVPALAMLAAGLTIAAVAIPIVSMQYKAAGLRDSFAVVRRRAEAIAAVKKEILALRTEQDFLLRRKQQTITVSRLLADVTRILPDDTWLTDFDVAGDKLQLGGYALSASSLVSLLERSRGFQHTSFLSPVTQDPLVGKERFSISTQVNLGSGS